MEFNWIALIGAGLIPFAVGFLWYGPIFGNAWMIENGFTKDSPNRHGMVKLMIFTVVFGLFAAVALLPVTIHQMGVMSTLMSPELEQSGTELNTYFAEFMSKYGCNFRTFKHGVFHGALMSIFFALPVIGMSALYENRSWKYIAIHLGYWLVSLSLMGGIISAFV